MPNQAVPSEAMVISARVIRNVKLLRRKKNLSIAALERLMREGGYPITRNSWERAEWLGCRQVSVDEFYALAHALKVSPGTLATTELT